jgi:hypothetical protein
MKRIISILLIGLALNLTFAQLDTLNLIQQAKADAKADAQKNTGEGWFWLGCFLLLPGVIISYNANPSVPPIRLLNKPAEYSLCYNFEYQQVAKSIQGSKAISGWLGAVFVTGVIYVLIISIK